MSTTLPRPSSAFADGPARNENPVAIAAPSSQTLRALSAPLFVVGLEWTVSGANKIIGNFVGSFSAYASSLQAQHIFLPGLSLIVRFPLLTARVAIATETGLGITLLLASIVFLRGANRIWEMIASTALGVSALVAAALWLMVGRPPFWPDGTANGYGSGWSIEFFLVFISAALAVGIAVADPEGTIFMRLKRRLRRRT